MQKKKKQTKQCPRCLKDKSLSQFYVSYDLDVNPDGRMVYCKLCLNEMVLDDNGEINLDKVKDVLRKIDRPFVQMYWDSALESGKSAFGVYLKNIALNMKDATWEDSDGFNNTIITQQGDSSTNINLSQEQISVLMDKWGFGYKPAELYLFEKKYNFLKNNYPEKTAMHTEALLNYVRYRVKEETATAEGNVKDAKEWGQLAQKAAQDAKINPSQLSKADLADGLSTFGELVRAVEQAVDAISILPKFKEKPQDKVDFTLWCYINYIRDLKGLPACDYKDIYEFYEERKKEYAKHTTKEENIFEQSDKKDIGDTDGEL